MVELGGEIVLGKGKCLNCHKVGGSAGGDRGPDLTDVGARAATRVAGMSGLEYLAQSRYEPDAFVVPGYSLGMVPANKPPIGLDQLEIAPHEGPAAAGYFRPLGRPRRNLDIIVLLDGSRRTIFTTSESSSSAS